MIETIAQTVVISAAILFVGYRVCHRLDDLRRAHATYAQWLFDEIDQWKKRGK